MAEVFGSLREDQATHGEKLVLKLLRENLPKEYAVYVECPLHSKRVLRYPDFIVLTNYGVMVLEVKDWIAIQSADKFNAHIRTRQNQVRKERNPVDQARQFALLLSKELRDLTGAQSDRRYPDIPWGFAVVLPNLPTPVITQLRQAWGDEFVLNKDDLQPNRITSRLKLTLPEKKVRDLTKEELRLVRAVINPLVLFEIQNRPPAILDDNQERIVSEPVKLVEVETPASEELSQQMTFEAPSKPVVQPGEIQPPVERSIIQNASIRLVRGVSGSGKTLVLIQRARYLAAQYPEWKIAVLTYNRALRVHLSAVLKGVRPVRAMNFHQLCRILFNIGGLPWIDPVNPIDWLRDNQQENPIIEELTPEFLDKEITWIKEIGLHNFSAYQNAERKGRGEKVHLSKERRKDVYRVLLDYQRYLKAENLLDWADIPYIVLKALDSGKIKSPEYNAILIDEAQDFAPIWIRLLGKLLHSESGVFFLADDPAQSIYRFYSWREKGVEVVGRTRHLRLPYRNTYEVYRAAYAVIQEDKTLQKALSYEGMLVVPDLDEQQMRHGPQPLLQRCQSLKQELEFISERVRGLLHQGVDGSQIAVLHRHKAGVSKINQALKGLDVQCSTFHACKGLEFEYVFISQLHDTFNRNQGEPELLSEERRLVYMAMTRTRHQLYMYYWGSLPSPLKCILDHVDSI
jgi:hypothetical protein